MNSDDQQVEDPELRRMWVRLWDLQLGNAAHHIRFEFPDDWETKNRGAFELEDSVPQAGELLTICNAFDASPKYEGIGRAIVGIALRRVAAFTRFIDKARPRHADKEEAWEPWRIERAKIYCERLREDAMQFLDDPDGRLTAQVIATRQRLEQLRDEGEDQLPRAE